MIFGVLSCGIDTQKLLRRRTADSDCRLQCSFARGLKKPFDWSSFTNTHSSLSGATKRRRASGKNHGVLQAVRGSNRRYRAKQRKNPHTKQTAKRATRLPRGKEWPLQEFTKLQLMQNIFMDPVSCAPENYCCIVSGRWQKSIRKLLLLATAISRTCKLRIGTVRWVMSQTSSPGLPKSLWHAQQRRVNARMIISKWLLSGKAWRLWAHLKFRLWRLNFADIITRPWNQWGALGFLHL